MSDLARLLADATEEAERRAPSVDPLREMARTRDRRRRRSAHLSALAFVGFVLAVQLDPAAAFGAQPEPVAVVAVSEPRAGG